MDIIKVLIVFKAYHSSQEFQRSICNVALMPLRQLSKYKGPAPRLPNDQTDIIDETIGFFR